MKDSEKSIAQLINERDKAFRKLEEIWWDLNSSTDISTEPLHEFMGLTEAEYREWKYSW